MVKNTKRRANTGMIFLTLFVAACSPVAMLQRLDANQATATEKSGVQLWTENCARCHYLRAIDSYSDAEWGVAALHMRVRANLTAADSRAITKYLKSAN